MSNDIPSDDMQGKTTLKFATKVKLSLLGATPFPASKHISIGP